MRCASSSDNVAWREGALALAGMGAAHGCNDGICKDPGADPGGGERPHPIIGAGACPSAEGTEAATVTLDRAKRRATVAQETLGSNEWSTTYGRMEDYEIDSNVWPTTCGKYKSKLNLNMY